MRKRPGRPGRFFRIVVVPPTPVGPAGVAPIPAPAPSAFPASAGSESRQALLRRAWVRLPAELFPSRPVWPAPPRIAAAAELAAPPQMAARAGMSALLVTVAPAREPVWRRAT